MCRVPLGNPLLLHSFSLHLSTNLLNHLSIRQAKRPSSIIKPKLEGEREVVGEEEEAGEEGE